MKNINADTPTLVLSTLDDSSHGRIQKIQSCLNVAGFRNVEFVQARTPQSEGFENRGLPPTMKGRWRTDLQHMWGSAACTLSHLDFLKRNPDELPIIVLEDDAAIHPHFFRLLTEVNFPDDVQWDLCHLSYVNEGLGSRANPNLVVNRHLIRCAAGQVPCTYSYILNRPVFDQLVPMVEEIDWQLANMTDTVASFVIEHTPQLTWPDQEFDSVRDQLDSVSWKQNNQCHDG